MSTLAQGTPNGPTKAGATRTTWRALVVPSAKCQARPTGAVALGVVVLKASKKGGGAGGGGAF
jgi:hypothetical protein